MLSRAGKSTTTKSIILQRKKEILKEFALSPRPRPLSSGRLKVKKIRAAIVLPDSAGKNRPWLVTLRSPKPKTPPSEKVAAKTLEQAAGD